MEGIAATVVLLRDAAHGPEVLLLKRPAKGSFANAWVFPGGVVDDHERVLGPDGRLDEAASALRAAVRETFEEVGLQLEADALIATARWFPPVEAPKRLITWFYCAVAPPGELALSVDEVAEARWLSPAAALAEHASGALLMYPPTWMTLHRLTEAASAGDALAMAGEPRRYATRFTSDRSTVVWAGDAAYDDPDALDRPGGRHRLDMRELPWRFLESD